MEHDEYEITLAAAGEVDPRTVALDALMLAAADVHLTPVQDSELVQMGARLLDEVFADYELSEVTDCVGRLTEQAQLRCDRSGRIVPSQAGRSSLYTARAFQVALECAETVSKSDPPYGLGTPNPCGRRVLAHALLSVEREREIARRAFVGNRAAINELVANNTRLVWSQTKSFARSSSGAMDREDYFQEACLGLIRAAEKFDPSREFRFSTYGVLWINQASRRAQANFARVIRLPVHVYDDVRRVRAVVARHESSVGLAPDPVEIGRALEMPVTDVVRLLEISEPVLSLDAHPNLLASLHGLVSDDGDARLTERDLREILDACLTERETELVRLRFGIGNTPEHTLDEVGRHFNITRERVRQIQTAALKKIGPLVKRALEAG